MVASAHAQDFERRKRPDQLHQSSASQGNDQSPEDTSEEDEDDDEHDVGDTRQYGDEDLAEELPFARTSRISEESRHG